MPRVSLYEGGAVQRQGTTQARLRPVDFGPNGLATGLQAVAGAVDDHSQRLERLQAEEQELRAKDADVQLNQAISDVIENPETGYRARRGKAAVETYEPTLQELQGIKAKVASTLKGKTKEIFEQAADQRLISARNILSQHYARERESWQDETSEARIGLAASDAGNAYQTPEEAEKYISTAVDEIRQRAQRKGWAPEMAAAETLKTVSGMRRDIAGRLADLQPELGEKYLEIHRAQFSSEDADKVEDAIRTRRAQELAEQRRLEREARQAEREAAADLAEQARDTVDLMERGNIVPPESVEKLATRLEQTGKPVLATKLRTTSAVQGFTSEARAWRPDQLQGWINDARTRTKSGATPEQHAQIEAAEKLLGEMKTGLEQDPLSWAVKSGSATLPPLDLAKPETAQARIRTALGVAERYGTKPTFLTDEEAASYAEHIAKSNANGKAATAGAIVRNFGRHSRDVLATLSNSDPVFAHAAALSAMGGQQASAARRIFAGQDAIAAKAVALPPDEKFNELGIGRALGFTPKTRAAILQSAKAMYASFALGGGFDPSVVNADTWGIVLNRAAGATYRRDNTRVGGFGEHRGVDIVLPRDVAPDEFGTLLGRVNDADLKALGAVPRYSNGKAVAAADLRKAYLFDAGAGRYFVSLNKAGSEFLRGPQGPYILNFGALVPRLRGRTARPPARR